MLQPDLNDSSSIQGIAMVPDLSSFTPLRCNVTAQNNGEYEGSGWRALAEGGSRFLDFSSSSYGAPERCVEPPEQRHVDYPPALDSSVSGRPHLLSEAANLLANSPSYDKSALCSGFTSQGAVEELPACESPLPQRRRPQEEAICVLTCQASFEEEILTGGALPEDSDDDKGDSTFFYSETEFNKKRKSCPTPNEDQAVIKSKKSRKKSVNIWSKSSSRKGGKKNSKSGSQSSKNFRTRNTAREDHVHITLATRHQEKIEDRPDLPVVLSKYHKAEKIELSNDRLTAGGTKGYRMVRATRGVVEGAWYFEIFVEKLGPSGHTRLGWSTERGEIQAPVGFDNYSYAYRDVDGSKVHSAVRELYGEPYTEGDVIGIYINLPNGAELAPKPETVVSYRGQPYILEEKEDPPKSVPGSEVVFFRNGKCQGTAFKDINAGRYFPAASMYTLPNDPKCVVRFNFGPDFRFPPTSIGTRPIPKPIACAPHCGIDSFSFWSIPNKSETSGLDATLTPTAQSTEKAR
ncbi:hypothetical protein KP509_12G085100 [Ceratopteris richardii]|uniref:B30.2/SPRY domain-containing protein n=1 Tax=Ceratopteris richardii TaxID=49495 RepID=A0A8T2TNQ3_CERRI|nr:hypothetical protein KP509_12G085100 [Ceratopteris richardii]